MYVQVCMAGYGLDGQGSISDKDRHFSVCIMSRLALGLLHFYPSGPGVCSLWVK